MPVTLQSESHLHQGLGPTLITPPGTRSLGFKLNMGKLFLLVDRVFSTVGPTRLQSNNSNGTA